MNKTESIEKKLSLLKPSYLRIVNESDAHIGHKGHDGTGESHFSITISSELFNGKTTLEKHKMVKELLKEDFLSGTHSITIKIKNS